MKKFLLLLSCSLALVGLLAGCATTEGKTDEEKVSTLPWNQPTNWGGGPGGGVAY